MGNNCQDGVPGFAICGGNCTDTRTDTGNCGGCGTVCINGTPKCEKSVCTQGSYATCTNTTLPTLCQNGGASCVNLMTNFFHCGDCYKDCSQIFNGGPGNCSVGQCQAVAPQSSTSTNSQASPTSSTLSSLTVVSTSSSSSSTSSPTNKSSPNISTGEVAGIGIACAIAGAILAGLILFFLLSRRFRRQASYRPQDVPQNNEGYLHQEKSGISTTVTNVDRLLPQPAEDDALASGLSKIRDGIKNHVQNYYHNAPVDPKMVDQTRLVDLARVMVMPTSAILDLLLNPATRIPMIRLFLAHLILSRCVGNTDKTYSFLPGEVAALAVADTGSKNTTAAQVALFSKWKSVSGTLLHQQYSKQPDENDPREASIAKALAAAEPVLRPFVNPSIDTNIRRRNLEGIMRRAAQFAFLMFSQPSSFVFDYSGTGQPDSLVVFPALLVTVSDEAERLSQPRLLSEKEVVSGLGRY